MAVSLRAAAKIADFGVEALDRMLDTLRGLLLAAGDFRPATRLCTECDGSRPGARWFGIGNRYLMVEGSSGHG